MRVDIQMVSGVPSAADESASAENLITLTAEIVAAHVSNNSVSPEQIPKLIANVHQALAGLGKEQKKDARPEPAVSIRSSVKKDHIVCLEDGKKMKMLKRHLMTDHGLTPDEYRARWGLSSDHPMVAPDYAERRRDLAKKIGLGRIPGQKRGRKPAPKTQAKKAAAPRKTTGATSESKPSRK
jgi:predicted transcriptional regulator